MSAQPLAAELGSLIEDETSLEPEKNLKKMWERLPAAINSVLRIPIIVAKSHSSKADKYRISNVEVRLLSILIKSSELTKTTIIHYSKYNIH